MPITLITGLPGHCKTLYAMVTIKQLSEREKRPVFYNGIPGVTLPWIEFDKGEEWFKCPQGAIVVIDECQRIFRLRANGAAVPDHVAQLETHRKAGHDVYLITQHPMLLDTNVRRLVDLHFHCRRWFGMEKSTIHEFHEVRVDCDRKREGGIRHEFFYPKEAYRWYKSAEVHTVKRRIPMRVWLLLLAPVVLIALCYWAYKTMVALGKKPAETIAATSNKGSVSSGAIASVPSTSRDDYQWLARQRPRIVGLPHTAPIYDDLTKPVSIPIPAACLSMGKRCDCFTDQGTRIAAVQEVVCREIVANGWYNPYQQGKAAQAVPADSASVSKSGSQPGGSEATARL